MNFIQGLKKQGGIIIFTGRLLASYDNVPSPAEHTRRTGGHLHGRGLQLPGPVPQRTGV